MFIANWSFDMHYGTREETIRTVKAMSEQIVKTGWKGKNTRILWGSIGVPESRITLQHEFDSLADLEASWAELHKHADMFGKMVASMKTLIVAGSPRWEIHRVV
jgi:hypothetical protein